MIKLQVVTPSKVVYDGEVDSFFVRASEGDLGILKGHAPLFTGVDVGLLQLKKAGETETLAVMAGFLEVHNDRATVLTEAAEVSADIDLLRAQQARDRAEARLKEQSTNVDSARAEAALKRAILRIRARDVLKR